MRYRIAILEEAFPQSPETAGVFSQETLGLKTDFLFSIRSFTLFPEFREKNFFPKKHCGKLENNLLFHKIAPLISIAYLKNVRNVESEKTFLTAIFELLSISCLMIKNSMLKEWI